MGKREYYKFSDRSTSHKGKIAFGLSVLSLCIQLGLIYKAVERAVTIMDGLIGFYSFLISIISIFFLIGSVREESIYSKYQVITIIFSVFVLILHGVIFGLGM